MTYILEESDPKLPMSSADQTQLVYPEFVLAKIGEISQKASIPVDTLKLDYEVIFKDPFIQKDPQFQTDEERHRYATATLWTRFVGRAPLLDVNVVPVGVAPKRLSKKGTAYASLFVLVKGKDGALKLARIAFQGDTIAELAGVTFFSAYTPKLGKFKQSEDFICDTRTKWENPKSLGAKPGDMLSRIQNIRRVTIEKAASFPSLTDQAGYANTLDWRVIRGMVWRKNDGIRKDGTTWANYTIGDDTTGRDDKVTKEGKVIPAGFTVWCDKLVWGFNNEDECDFYGTVAINPKDGTVSMNAYQVLPVIVRPQVSGA